VHLKLTYGQNEIEFDLADDRQVDVAALLHAVRDTHPDLYQNWSNREGDLRRSLTVFVNGEHIRYRNGLQTELEDGDEIRVIPIVAGG
jgi:molybdopterin synthase sulfur carrier subunit